MKRPLLTAAPDALTGPRDARYGTPGACGAVGVFALGWIVSCYAEQIHAAGSLYDYVTRGLGERVGTATGWLYYGGVVVLLTGLLLLMGGYLQSTIASEFKVNPLPSWAWTLLVIALIAAILYFGVRLPPAAFVSTFVLRARWSASSELADLSANTVA